MATTRLLSAVLSAATLLLCVLGLAGATWVLTGSEDVEVEWHRFKRHFGRRYHSQEEEAYRFQVFHQSFHRALARNERNVQLGGGRVFGVTRFSDETQEEFDRRYKGRKGHGKGARHGHPVRRPLASVSAAMEEHSGQPSQQQHQHQHHHHRLRSHGGGGSSSSSRTYHQGGEQTTAVLAAAGGRPDAVDWVARGATTSVNNQGQCGSCWAFSLTQQVESAWIMAGNAPWRLSVQQATSCTSGVFGCGGGDTIEGYEQLLAAATKRGMEVPGLVSAAMAPYVQSMYDECLSPRCTERCTAGGIGNLTVAEEMEGLTGFYVGISGWDYGTPPCDDACEDQDLELLKANLAEYGPASVCVNAAVWNDYVSGVLMTDACGGFGYGDLDHCVSLVGYNDTAEVPYFKVRNSWATSYGMDGHILLSSEGNTCGIANEATFVTIAPQPSDED